jgi:hypothetical protein
MLRHIVDAILGVAVLVTGCLAVANYARAQCPNACGYFCTDLSCKVSWVGGVKECIIVKDGFDAWHLTHCFDTLCNLGAANHECEEVSPPDEVYFFWSDDCEGDCDDDVEITQEAFNCESNGECVMGTGATCIHWNRTECIPVGTP